MTNEYYARRVPIEKLAEQRIASVSFSEVGEGITSIYYKHVTDDNIWFMNKNEAIKHEIEWLKQEADG